MLDIITQNKFNEKKERKFTVYSKNRRNLKCVDTKL